MKSVALCSVAVRASHVEKQGRREGDSVDALTVNREHGVQGWGAYVSSIMICCGYDLRRGQCPESERKKNEKSLWGKSVAQTHFPVTFVIVPVLA